MDYRHVFRKTRSCERQLFTTFEAITKLFIQNEKQVDLLVLNLATHFNIIFLPQNKTEPHDQEFFIGLKTVKAKEPSKWFAIQNEVFDHYASHVFEYELGKGFCPETELVFFADDIDNN